MSAACSQAGGIHVPSSDQEALKELAASYPELDEWRSRLSEPLMPGRDSTLAQDDLAWPYSPLSALAASKIASGVDHLQALRALAEAKSFHPTATYTLSRSALLAASEAVWLLAPAQAGTRQSRGLRSVERGYKEQLNYLREVAKGQGVIWPAAALLRGHLELRLSGAARQAAEVKASGLSDATSIVRVAARLVQPDHPDWEHQAVAQWRSGSGSAHAHQYAALGHATRAVGPDPEATGLHVFQSGGSVVLAWERHYVAFETLRFAWARWSDLAAPGSGRRFVASL